MLLFLQTLLLLCISKPILTYEVLLGNAVTSLHLTNPEVATILNKTKQTLRKMAYIVWIDRWALSCLSQHQLPILYRCPISSSQMLDTLFDLQYRSTTCLVYWWKVNSLPFSKNFLPQLISKCQLIPFKDVCVLSNWRYLFCTNYPNVISLQISSKG